MNLDQDLLKALDEVVKNTKREDRARELLKLLTEKLISEFQSHFSDARSRDLLETSGVCETLIVTAVKGIIKSNPHMVLSEGAKLIIIDMERVAVEKLITTLVKENGVSSMSKSINELNKV